MKNVIILDNFRKDTVTLITLKTNKKLGISLKYLESLKGNDLSKLYLINNLTKSLLEEPVNIPISSLEYFIKDDESYCKFVEEFYEEGFLKEFFLFIKEDENSFEQLYQIIIK